MAEKEIRIDLKEVWQAIVKGKFIIGVVTLLAVVLAGIYLVVATPTYEATTLLRVQKPQGLGGSLLDSVAGISSSESKQRMSTYAEILKSRSVVQPVVDKLNDQKENKGSAIYDNYVKKHITTVPLKDTEILQVKVTGNTPDKAKEANDLLINSFLNRLTELTRGEQRTTRTFIEKRVVDAKKELLAAEQKLTDFKKEHKVLEPDSQIKIAAEKLTMADKLKAENKIALEAASAREAAVAAQMKGNTASIAGNNVLKGLQVQLADLEAKRIQLLAQYTDKHPDVVQVNQDIAGIRQAMDKEIKKIAALQAPSDNSLFQALLADKFKAQAEEAVAQGNLSAIGDIENQYKNEVANLSDTEQEYLNLLRDVTVSQEIYTMLAKRLEEAKVAEAGVSTEVQVVDRAALPDKPIKPQKTLIMALAFILGLLLSSIAVVVYSLFNRRITTSEDVENYLQWPVLGQIPFINQNKSSKKLFSNKLKRSNK